MASSWLTLGLILVGLTALMAIAYVWLNPAAVSLTPWEARALLYVNDIDYVVDVRSRQEYESGHYRKAIHIPLSRLNKDLPHRIPDRSARILFYCHSGHRAAMAAHAADRLGYTSTMYLAHGDWKELEQEHIPIINV